MDGHFFCLICAGRKMSMAGPRHICNIDRFYFPRRASLIVELGIRI